MTVWFVKAFHGVDLPAWRRTPLRGSLL